MRDMDHLACIALMPVCTSSAAVRPRQYRHCLRLPASRPSAGRTRYGISFLRYVLRRVLRLQASWPARAPQARTPWHTPPSLPSSTTEWSLPQASEAQTRYAQHCCQQAMSMCWLSGFLVMHDVWCLALRPGSACFVATGVGGGGAARQGRTKASLSMQPLISTCAGSSFFCQCLISPGSRAFAHAMQECCCCCPSARCSS
jgi:hypothetical protein